MARVRKNVARQAAPTQQEAAQHRISATKARMAGKMHQAEVFHQASLGRRQTPDKLARTAKDVHRALTKKATVSSVAALAGKGLGALGRGLAGGAKAVAAGVKKAHAAHVAKSALPAAGPKAPRKAPRKAPSPKAKAPSSLPAPHKNAAAHLQRPALQQGKKGGKFYVGPNGKKVYVKK